MNSASSENHLGWVVVVVKWNTKEDDVWETSTTGL
jgi:hypothetical protein